ncbi:MAG: GtrA family protein [Deltaproteobacteria bacterium]|nr:GtrA family protein [Deltaproteobacteria bacterium]
MSLVIKYALFAILATEVNILGQDITSRFYHGQYELYLSMFCGTMAGLVVKYVLDKKYIFCYKTNSLADDTRKFILYSAMGVITTLVFWGVEIGFDHLFGARYMRYLGGAIGLTIGYLVKYQLDKRLVFVEPT